jgi:hypothetical protein
MSETNNSAVWQPPQAKYVRWAINGILGFGVLLIASFVVKKTVPTISDAFLLLQKMMENFTNMAITAGIMVAVLWFLYETFSPKGKINGLFAQAYSSFIRNLTLELLNVDPITPLTDSLRAVRKKKAEYDEQFARFDGQIQILTHEQERFLASAAKSEKQAKAAKETGNIEAFNRAAYKAGSDRDAANNFGKMIAKLTVIRTVIVKLQSAAGDIIYKLEIDIDSTKSQWEAAKSMSAMEKSARGIMEGAGKNELAREAQALVENKYAASIGRLNNLSDAAKPLLESIDLDKATYSQELLDKWEAEERSATVAIPMQATVLAPLPLAAPAQGVTVPAGGSKFAGLIDNQ